ncbi:MAG: GGDEF domain-containing protein [Deltaproteobacteria bacterium]|nr:GGDEF domain-containing protein [Deltaproteobacteria bacterium]
MADKSKILDLISKTTLEVMKELASSGERLNPTTFKEKLGEKTEISNFLTNLSLADSWKSKYENLETDFESISKENERVNKQKDHLLKKLERFDDIDSSSDAFFKRILILFCELIKYSDNRTLDLQIKEFKALIKKNADKQLLEKSFNQLKDTILTETDDERESLKPKKQSKSLGLLGKWTKSNQGLDQDGIEYALQLTQIFQEIIDEFKLVFRDNYLEKLLAIEKKMHKTTKIDNFSVISKSLVDLLQEYIANVNSDREQTSLFIKEIGQKVVDIDSIIVESFSSLNESETSHDNFHEFLENNITDLENSVNIGKTIEELRGTVVKRLSGINEAIRKQKMDAIVRNRDSEKRFSKLAGYFGKMKKSMEVANSKAKVLEKEINIDPLTGAANRRAYENRMKEEMDRYLRYKSMFAILIFDIDHFKKINDTYGHAIGDVCLKEIIKRVTKLLRKSDFLARIGGEEFVALLPETDKEGALDAAERFRKTVAKIEFIHRKETVTITISAGVTCARESDKKFEDIFKRMDSALYDAKNSGRNRVAFK